MREIKVETKNGEKYYNGVSSNKLCELSNIDEETMERFNKILEENGLLKFTEN